MKVVVGILVVVVAVLAWQVYKLRSDAVSERDLAAEIEARERADSRLFFEKVDR